jgi:hypothetical protein
MSSNPGFFEKYKSNPPKESEKEDSAFAEVAEESKNPEATSPKNENPFEAGSPESSEEKTDTSKESEGNFQEERKRVQLPEKKPTLPKTLAMPVSENFGFEAKSNAPREQPANSPSQSSAPNPFADQSESESLATAAPASDSRNEDQASSSDSSSIKQLELRAIFGSDRELSHEEILERAGSLPGIRKVAVATEDGLAALSSLRKSISNLGFGNAQIKIQADSLPIEFIKEGNALLAVQVEGEFGPGVRETLMIVARELGR